MEFAKDLVKTKILECNQVAFLLLWENKEALKLIRLTDIEELGQNVDSWASVDTLSILVSGLAWRENQISDNDILNWLKSDKRWWRRTAVVSTVPLNLKALSWALRELSKSDKPAVESLW